MSARDGVDPGMEVGVVALGRVTMSREVEGGRVPVSTDSRDWRVAIVLFYERGTISWVAL